MAILRPHATHLSNSRWTVAARVLADRMVGRGRGRHRPRHPGLGGPASPGRAVCGGSGQTWRGDFGLSLLLERIAYPFRQFALPAPGIAAGVENCDHVRVLARSARLVIPAQT